MPSTSRSSESSGGIDVEAVDSTDGHQRRPSASVDPRSKSHRRLGYHPRVRAAALATEVATLEAEVDALEAEVKALEHAVESKERQRQQVIDTYETIVTGRSETDRAPDAAPTTSTETASAETTSAETAGWRPLTAIASRLERAVARLRRPNE